MRYEQTSYTRNAPEIQRKCLVIRGAFFGGALPLSGGHENEGDMTLSHIFVHCNRQMEVNYEKIFCPQYCGYDNTIAADTIDTITL